MFKSKLSKVIVSLLLRIAGVTRSGAKRLMRAMLQALMAMGRRAKLPVAGFVLPTVTMVLLVVILLTVAIVLRSFDRANMARNVRVNQQVLAAATPALDRAKAKIEYMLREDPQRPTSTPSDTELYRIMSSYVTPSTATNPDFYTFGGETRLRLQFPVVNGTSLVNAGTPQGPLVNQAGQENEAINTAWRYPVDTNNDGIFDTYTLYGIFFRNPPIANSGDFRRARKPLDARTPPMSLGGLANTNCIQGIDTVASLVGDSGWYRVDGRLQKSFFVYTVNVPITQADIAANGLSAAQFQAFTGTSSVSALEYQQDQSRIPLSNNAVVYEDDLEISPGPPLNLNGRIFTNSNLLVSGTSSDRSIRLHQVSSKQSCFYDQENSKIVVGGNLANGWSGNILQKRPVEVHLYKKIDDPNPDVGAPAIDTTNESATQDSLDVLYNSVAYSQRLAALVAGQMTADPIGATDPVSVQRARLAPLNQQRDDALESYFKERLRKVPFAEAALGTNGGVDPAVLPNTYLQGSVDTLRPIAAWSLPTAGTAEVGAVGGPTGLTLNLNQPPAHNPENVKPAFSEPELGDRLAIGNNLPAKRWDGSKFISNAQRVDGATQWTDVGTRTRTPQVTKLADVGATDRGNGLGEAPNPANPFRDGFWEKTAAQIPISPLDGTGGLRVITSAGVYDRTNSFLPPPKWIDPVTGNWRSGPVSATVPFATANTYDDPTTPGLAVEQYPVVWPDSMPMSPLGPGSQVYNNTGVGANEAANWTTWVPAPTGGVRPEVVVAQPDYSDLPPTQANPNFPFVAENPATTRQFAKGDLRMRASAVYHYATSGYDPVALAAAPAGTQPTQAPFACVSSYYDPSNASTARNILTGGLPDVSGQGAQAPEVLAGNLPALGAQQAFIGSNNGVTYGPPTRPVPGGRSNLDPVTGLLSAGDPVLDAQANLVFPDGRFANGPLRTALQLPQAQRTLAQQAAIDSTNCALQILDRTIVPAPGLIPHGAIQEVAFINGREIKATDRDNPNTIVNEAFTLSSPLPGQPQAANLTSNYNQPLEEREPLEIRATQLDINALRGTNIAGPNTTVTEWLLPNSGIIYAGRDDALPDRSDRTVNITTGQIDITRSQRISPSDYLLDPTRKPNGIVVINGQNLFRGGANPAAINSVIQVVREKGLTLVSNLPAYIKGTFNPHGNIPLGATNPRQVEEFDERIADGVPFYQRTTLSRNFACRAGDPRLPNCAGDFWRPATVLGDSMTLLSQNYRFGFRNEGDFDLRNNAGAAAVFPRRQQGFFNNNFVTNGLSSGAFSDNGNLLGIAGASPTPLTDATYVAQNPPLTSSYFNNFVTPVQRRGQFREYVMEVCTKLPVSECTDADWFVDLRAGAQQTARAVRDAGTNYTSPNPANPNASPFQAGSTVDPPIPALQRFPRRVAFDRDTTNQLLTPNNPNPLGINGGTIAPGVGAVRGNNALWFAANNGGSVAYNANNAPYQVNTSAPPTTIDGSQVPLPTLAAASTTPLVPVTVPPAALYSYNGSQPLLVPVPQLMDLTPGAGTGVQTTGWMPRAVNTTFNLILGAGDTPSRALDNQLGDTNGGLQNLPRFLELWSADGVFTNDTNIQGSFIQQNRSVFSTAPYQPILNPSYIPPNPIDQISSLFATSPDPATQLTRLPGSRTFTRYLIQGGGRFSYFTPPTRNWGFDVGLLSQPPDLFTQKFTTPGTRTQPAEYFREVGRDDNWVKTLMCGVTDNGGTNATSSRPQGTFQAGGCPT